MLQERSIINITDNCGATKVMLFSVNGKNNQSFVRVGAIAVGSVKKASPNGKVKKGQIVHVLIVRTRSRINRKDGSSISFSDNAGVVVNKTNREPIATRIFGPVARELREKGHHKVVSLAEEVL
jgi:large subunit ribosomal protein L14